MKIRINRYRKHINIIKPQFLLLRLNFLFGVVKMKKIFCLILILCTLAGCGGGEEIDTKLVGITFDADVEYEDYECECSVKAYGGGVFSCTVNKPETISGTEVKYDGEETTITYMGITYKPDAPIPTENIAAMLSDVVKNTSPAQKNGEQYEVYGKTGIYSYTLTVTEAGLPLYLKCPSADLTVEFTNVKIINEK